MKKDLSIIILGLVVVVTPFLGVPTSWKNVIFVVAGLVITGLAYLLRMRANDTIHHMDEKRTETFVENGVRVSDGIEKAEHGESQDNKVSESPKI